MVIACWLTATAPSTTASAITAFGTRVSIDQNQPSTPAIAIRVRDEPGRLGVVRARGLRGAAERLQHPDPGRGLLDQRGQVAVLVLRAPGEDLVASART